MPINQDPYRHTHLSTEQIVAYLTHQLDDKESHEFEKHLLSCNLCQDAVDGYETMNVREIEEDLELLESRLYNRQESSVVSWQRLAIAAGISVLLVSVFITYQFLFPTQELEGLAMNENESKPDSLQFSTRIVSTDSVSKPNLKVDDKDGVETVETKKNEPIIPKNRPKSTALQVPIAEKYEEVADVEKANPSVRQALAKKSEEKSTAKEVVSAPVLEEEMAMGFGDEMADDEFEEDIIMEEVIDSSFDNRQNMKVTGVVSGATSVPLDSVGDMSLASSFVTKKESLPEIALARKKVAEKPKTELFQVDPQPVIGMEEYTKEVQRNLIYPSSAIENSMSGTVVLTFKVTKEGTIQNVRVTRGLGFGCDNEAIRLIEETGEWKAGSVNGISQEMDVSITVVFKLPE